MNGFDGRLVGIPSVGIASFALVNELKRSTTGGEVLKGDGSRELGVGGGSRP